MAHRFGCSRRSGDVRLTDSGTTKNGLASLCVVVAGLGELSEARVRVAAIPKPAGDLLGRLKPHLRIVQHAPERDFVVAQSHADFFSLGSAVRPRRR
jgi:hypothetical protein